jgi:hypothetical protein
MLGRQVGPQLDDDIAAAGKGKYQPVVGHVASPKGSKLPRFRRPRALAPVETRQ